MSNNIVAPLYEPAAAYHAPIPVPVELSVDTVSIEELLSTQELQTIVKKHAAWALAAAGSAQLKPFLSIFTLRDLLVFLPIDGTSSLAAIDVDLSQLPRSAWPRDVR